MDTASKNNLFQDAPDVSDRRARNTSQNKKPTSNVFSFETNNIFASTSVSLQGSGVKSLPSVLNANMAKNALDYVAKVSTVTAHRAQDLYKSVHRDEEGKLVDMTLSEQGRVLKERLETFRGLADRRHDVQLDVQTRKKRLLSEAQQKAQLAKHVLAAFHETASRRTANQMPTNCYEKALLSFEVIAKRQENPQLDVVGLTPSLPRTATDARTGEKVFLPRGPDHTVLIIGRASGSDVTASNTWGPDAIICDASNNEFYPVKEINSRFAQSVTGSADGPLIFESVISLSKNSNYDPNPDILHDIPEDQAATTGPMWVAFSAGSADTGRDDESDNEALFF